MAKNWREVRAAAKLDETAVAKHRKRLDDEVRARIDWPSSAAAVR